MTPPSDVEKIKSQTEVDQLLEEANNTKSQPVHENSKMEVKPDEIKRATAALKDMHGGREPTLSELEQYFNENGVSKDKLMPPRE